MNWTNLGAVTNGDWDGYKLELENGIIIYVTSAELDLLDAGEKLTNAICRRYPVED